MDALSLTGVGQSSVAMPPARCGTCRCTGSTAVLEHASRREAPYRETSHPTRASQEAQSSPLERRRVARREAAASSLRRRSPIAGVFRYEAVAEERTCAIDRGGRRNRAPRCPAPVWQSVPTSPASRVAQTSCPRFARRVNCPCCSSRIESIQHPAGQPNTWQPRVPSILKRT